MVLCFTLCLEFVLDWFRRLLGGGGMGEGVANHSALRAHTLGKQTESNRLFGTVDCMCRYVEDPGVL